jgi:hypothetical protein
MKNALSAVLSFLFLASPLAALAASGFQGEVDTQVKGALSQSADKLFYKGGLMKLVSYAEDGSIVSFSILDHIKKVGYVVSAIDKTYQTFPLAAKVKPSEAAIKAVTLAPTGKHKTIVGKDCEEYQVTGEGHSATAYVTKGYTDILGNAQALLPGGLATEEKLRRMSLLTMELDIIDGVTYTVTKIEPRAVPDSEFEIPQGYKKIASDDSNSPGAPVKNNAPKAKAGSGEDESPAQAGNSNPSSGGSNAELPKPTPTPKKDDLLGKTATDVGKNLLGF